MQAFTLLPHPSVEKRAERSECNSRVTFVAKLRLSHDVFKKRAPDAADRSARKVLLVVTKRFASRHLHIAGYGPRYRIPPPRLAYESFHRH